MAKKKDTEAFEKLRQRIESQANVKANPNTKPEPEAKPKANGGGKSPPKNVAKTPEPEPEPVIAKTTQEDLDKELENQEKRMAAERDNKIPGYGWLFGIQDKFLPESTVLDRGEVLAFALGNMQENMLNPNRTESLFAMFAKDIMRMNVSVKGLARDQAIIVRQQDADKGATMNTLRDLTGRPGAL
jgi:hypothetical protein